MLNIVEIVAREKGILLSECKRLPSGWLGLCSEIQSCHFGVKMQQPIFIGTARMLLYARMLQVMHFPISYYICYNEYRVFFVEKLHATLQNSTFG